MSAELLDICSYGMSYSRSRRGIVPLISMYKQIPKTPSLLVCFMSVVC